mgnify:CR=1 FL=1
MEMIGVNGLDEAAKIIIAATADKKRLGVASMGSKTALGRAVHRVACRGG